MSGLSPWELLLFLFTGVNLADGRARYKEIRVADYFVAGKKMAG
jgi:hypothetical protein